MAVKTYSWITAWFLITLPIIAWDVSYCMMRPRSFFGGDLHWIWSPYALYQNIDLVYGVAQYERGDGFTNAQSLLNIFETILNMAYLYLAHISEWSPAPVVGFAAVVMTLSKTLLYWAQEYYCGYCAVGHNNLKDLIVLWMIPNGLWLVVPGIIIWVLGRDIANSLKVAEKAELKLTSGKTQ